jgi:hypothetical protein
MKRIVFAGALIALCGAMAYAAQQTTISRRDVEDPVRLRTLLVANATDVALVATDLTNGTGTVSVQLKDGAGADLETRALLRVWSAATAYAAPATNNVDDMMVSTGTDIEEVLADAHHLVLTDTNGLAVITFDLAADATTNYIQVATGWRVATVPLAVTGNN